MSGTQSSAQHRAAALAYQADGDWAAVSAEYQAAVDMLDPTAGSAINNAKSANLGVLIADANARSRGYVAPAGIPSGSAGGMSGAVAVLSTAIHAIGTGAGADAGSLLAA